MARYCWMHPLTTRYPKNYESQSSNLSYSVINGTYHIHYSPFFSTIGRENLFGNNIYTESSVNSARVSRNWGKMETYFGEWIDLYIPFKSMTSENLLTMKM